MAKCVDTQGLIKDNSRKEFLQSDLNPVCYQKKVKGTQYKVWLKPQKKLLVEIQRNGIIYTN